MNKIKMYENDSIRNLTEVMVNSCGIDRAQANAAVNAIEMFDIEKPDDLE